MIFTVKNPSIIYKSSMMVVVILGMIMLISTLFESQRELAMYIVVTLCAIPFAIGAIWAKRYYIIVRDTTITVQKGLAWKPFSIEISDITRVVSIVSNTYAGLNINMKIYTGSGKRFNVETLMVNSDEMFDFIDKNVPKERTQTTFRNLVSK